MALIQRCQWHKRENVVSYLPEQEKKKYRSKLQRAYEEPEYEIARSRLFEIYEELLKINRSAANSLLEGLEETLKIHRLGLREELGSKNAVQMSFCTTNIIENVNSQLSRKLRNVKRWRDSQMIARWVAISLLDIEERLNRLKNYQKLHLLKEAMKTEFSKNPAEKIEKVGVA